MHGLSNQLLFGPELAEEGVLIDTGGVGNATSGRSAKAVLRKDVSSGGQNFIPAFHEW